jgi:hypothetical protein
MSMSDKKTMKIFRKEDTKISLQISKDGDKKTANIESYCGWTKKMSITEDSIFHLLLPKEPLEQK